MRSERLERYFTKHPRQRLLLSVIIGAALTVLSVCLIGRSVELSFGTEIVTGTIVYHSTGGRSSSYNYEFKVAGQIHKDKLIVMLPIFFNFEVGERTPIVFNSRDPSISTPAAAMFQEYISCVLSAAIVLTVWFACWKFAVETAIEGEVDSLDLKEQVKEFEEERQRKQRERE